MLNVKLNVFWEILCNRKSKIWVALPIETPNQKIKQIKIQKAREIKKEIKTEFFHYLYLETLSKKTIQSEIIMQLDKISKYEGVMNNRFLKDNKILQIKKIKPLALKLKTPINFYAWIVKNIRFPKDLSRYLTNLNCTETAMDVLKNKEGECGGKSLLFLSLCRAAGIPARLVSGYFLKSGEISLLNASFDKDSLELHQWAEFYDGKYWIPVDCSLAQEEDKDYFGKFNDYRIIVSKDMNFKLDGDGTVPFLQIGEIKPKDLNNSNIRIKIRVRKWKK